MEEIMLDHKVLFLEFFVREFSFNGKGTVRTTLPPDAFFYTCPSKAMNTIESHYPHASIKDIEPPGIGFNDQNILIKSKDVFDKITHPHAQAVLAIGGEFYARDAWFRNKNKVIVHKTATEYDSLKYATVKGSAPCGFDVWSVAEDGTVTTTFPRSDVNLEIAPAQTLCFLCRREEREDFDWYQPNLNLVMFVKNHGLHDNILFDAKRVMQYDHASLCLGSFLVRDFRKSKLKFDLG